MFKTIHSDIERMLLAEGKGSIAVLDIDHFKQVNDKYGHQVGDDVLKKTAQALKSRLTDMDFIARFGGEEFVVWLPERSLDEREQIFSKLHQSVSEVVLDRDPITISIGVCHFDFAQKKDLECKRTVLEYLIDRADSALYEAKKQGRDRIITVTS